MENFLIKKFYVKTKHKIKLEKCLDFMVHWQNITKIEGTFFFFKITEALTSSRTVERVEEATVVFSSSCRN